MSRRKSFCGSKNCSPPACGWILGALLLLAWAAPAAALVARGEVDGGGLNLKVSYASPQSTSKWAVEVRGAGQAWPGMLLGPQGQVWARLPGLAGGAEPQLVVRHPASGRQAQVSGARQASLASGGQGGDWWLLESDARDWVDQAPAALTPASGQSLWAYTFSPRRDRLVRNAYPARVSGDQLGLSGDDAPSLGLVTDRKDRAVGLLSGPSAVTTLAQAREALNADPVAEAKAEAVVTPVSTVVPPTTLPPAATQKETKENSGMPEYVCVILGLFAVPLVAWLMGRMVFRATWGRMSPYKGVAMGMAVFWVLLAFAEYWIWVGLREPREALLQVVLSVGLPSLFSWTVILSNIFRRLRD